MAKITRGTLVAMHMRKHLMQSLCFKFAGTGTGINALAQLANNSTSRYHNPADGMWVMAMTDSGTWDGPQRTICLYPGQALLNDSFQRYAVDGGGIESITCGGMSPLNALQSSRIVKPILS